MFGAIFTLVLGGASLVSAQVRATLVPPNAMNAYTTGSTSCVNALGKV
jgi:hypothetical protein